MMKKLNEENMDQVVGGYREGMYPYKQDSHDEQYEYVRWNSSGSAESNIPYYDTLQHWLDYNVAAENSNLSMVDVISAVKQGYGME